MKASQPRLRPDLAQWKHESLSLGMQGFNALGIMFSTVGMSMGFASSALPVLAIGSIACAPCSVACSYLSNVFGAQIKKNQRQDTHNVVTAAKEKAGHATFTIDDVHNIRKAIKREVKKHKLAKINHESINAIVDKINHSFSKKHSVGKGLQKVRQVAKEELGNLIETIDEITQTKIKKHSNLTAIATKASFLFSTAAFSLGVAVFTLSNPPVALSIVLGMCSLSSLTASSFIIRRGYHVDDLLNAKSVIKEGAADLAIDKVHGKSVEAVQTPEIEDNQAQEATKETTHEEPTPVKTTAEAKQESFVERLQQETTESQNQAIRL